MSVYLGLLNGDAMDGETSLDIVDETEVFSCLLDANHIWRRNRHISIKTPPITFCQQNLQQRLFCILMISPSICKLLILFYLACIHVEYPCPNKSYAVHHREMSQYMLGMSLTSPSRGSRNQAPLIFRLCIGCTQHFPGIMQDVAKVLNTVISRGAFTRSHQHYCFP